MLSLNNTINAVILWFSWSWLYNKKMILLKDLKF